MNPSNPTNTQPLIYSFEDDNGNKHKVAPVQHSHSISEVDNLQATIAAIQSALNDAIQWKTMEQVNIGVGGYNRYSNGILYNLEYQSQYFQYQQIRLLPVNGSDTDCEYGAIKQISSSPASMDTGIDFDTAVLTHHTSTYVLQVLQ